VPSLSNGLVLGAPLLGIDGAQAALRAAEARVTESGHALTAATRDVELYSVEIADNILAAPTDGRIQYRRARVREVLAAGGKVFVMLARRRRSRECNNVGWKSGVTCELFHVCRGRITRMHGMGRMLRFGGTPRLLLHLSVFRARSALILIKIVPAANGR